MAFKLGSLKHAKGYVIHKLYEQRRFEVLVTYLETEPRKQPSGVPIDILD